jgi:hypothetical protein
VSRVDQKHKRAERDAPAEPTTVPTPTARLHLGECTRLIDRRQRMLSALVASIRGRIRDAWL